MSDKMCIGCGWGIITEEYTFLVMKFGWRKNFIFILKECTCIRVEICRSSRSKLLWSLYICNDLPTYFIWGVE